MASLFARRGQVFPRLLKPIESFAELKPAFAKATAWHAEILQELRH
jgi:hypothetical protein